MQLSYLYRNKVLKLPLISASLALALTSCSSNPRAARGSAAGAVLGGVVGAATGGLKGAAIGAAAGGASGAAIGAYLDHRQKELSKVVQTQKTDQGLLITLQNGILFDTNKTDLKPAADDTLSKLAAILVKYPKDRLEIMGFTDDVGTEKYNQQLSERRAETVKQALTAKGVKDEQVKAIGKGELANTVKTAEGREASRKVEIYIDPEVPQNVKDGKDTKPTSASNT